VFNFAFELFQPKAGITSKGASMKQQIEELLVNNRMLYPPVHKSPQGIPLLCAGPTVEV